MMRDVLQDRARALIARMGTAASLTTTSGVHAVRGIYRAPHAEPQLGYGISSRATADVLDILLDDVPDVARSSRVQIKDRSYDVVEVEPDDHRVMARLALAEAQT